MLPAAMTRRVRRKTSRRLKVLLALCSLGVAALLGEVVLRLHGGYRVFALRLDRSGVTSGDPIAALAAADDLVQPLLERWQRRNPTIDPQWIRTSPPPLPSPPPLDKPLLPLTDWPLHYYVVNANLVRLLRGAGEWDPSVFPEVVTVFEPKDGNPRPSYRYPPSCRLPSGLITNKFGFRGRELTVDKPERTVRIGFVGASTTVEAHGHGFPHSAPELIEHWLMLYAKARGLDVSFETLNAGREGVQSPDMRAIVIDELLPLEVDYVVYYEGANQFRREFLKKHVAVEGKHGVGAPPPGLVAAYDETDNADTTTLDRLSSHLAAARYLRAALRSGKQLAEPDKPAQRVTLADELLQPDFPLDRAGEVLAFGEIQRDLDTIDERLRASSARLVLATFWWLAKDGLLLDANQSQNTHIHLNREFWPYRYSVVRQLADVQNNFYRSWAKAHDVDVLEIGDELPQDPRLSIDAIHHNDVGIRLKAWLMFEQLVPLIERDLAAGRVPVPDRHADATHPNIGAPIRVPRDELRDF